MRPGNYEEQARTYDLTRRASPTLVRLLSKYLGASGGRRTLLDVAGGTGNYAEAMAAGDFRPVVIDLEVAMLARAREKVGRVVAGDAARLPFRDGSFDTAMLVSALHLLEDQGKALGEARRVIREGPFLLQAFTEENLVPLFVFEYFPGSAPPPRMHRTADEIESMLGACWIRKGP